MKYKPQIVTAYYVQQGLPAPAYEYCHIPDRKFRLDLAFPPWKVGVEVEGGLFMKTSGHKSIDGLKRDMEKHNMSVLAGWRVLRVRPEQLCLLDTVNAIRQLIDISSDITNNMLIACGVMSDKRKGDR